VSLTVKCFVVTGLVRVDPFFAGQMLYNATRPLFVPCRECIPGLPFPGRPGIPVIIRSRIPGNRTASFPAKTGTVQLTALLSFSVVAACLRDASSMLD